MIFSTTDTREADWNGSMEVLTPAYSTLSLQTQLCLRISLRQNPVIGGLGRRLASVPGLAGVASSSKPGNAGWYQVGIVKALATRTKKRGASSTLKFDFHNNSFPNIGISCSLYGTVWKFHEVSRFSDVSLIKAKIWLGHYFYLGLPHQSVPLPTIVRSSFHTPSDIKVLDRPSHETSLFFIWRFVGFFAVSTSFSGTWIFTEWRLSQTSLLCGLSYKWAVGSWNLIDARDKLVRFNGWESSRSCKHWFLEVLIKAHTHLSA